MPFRQRQKAGRPKPIGVEHPKQAEKHACQADSGKSSSCSKQKGLGKHLPNKASTAAPKRVVDLSEFMLAVWDGQPAKGKGGTADVVSYAQQKATPVLILDPIRRQVIGSRET